MEFYPIVDISHVEMSDFEQMGTKSKFWYKDEDGQLFLFKATLSTNSAGVEVLRDGEDWAEKISSEIARLLGIPCARYDLAIRNGQRGVITPNFVSSEENMLYGIDLISDMARKLGMDGEDSNKLHRIPEISVCIDKYIKHKPKGWDSLPKIKKSSDFFIGYLMLDVLISNQDRHNENWGMIASKDKHPYLAPTFDHGASLGRNESDINRRIRLETKDLGQTIQIYVKKAKSQIYSKEGRRLKTIDAFKHFAFSNGDDGIDVALSWLQILSNIKDDALDCIVDRVPDSLMSDITKEFTKKVIFENKRRLLDCMFLFEEMRHD